jgi:hypothetical protein
VVSEYGYSGSAVAAEKKLGPVLIRHNPRHKTKQGRNRTVASS